MDDEAVNDLKDEQSFEKLAEQAASGLKSDQELYLDVKQELRTHLEETADKFALEGHTEDESVDLARKSFGSPLDVAADLLTANKRRMKLRALFRLAFGALIVPVAVVLALYLGYGRFARLAPIATGNRYVLPMLPFFGISWYSDATRLSSIPELDRPGDHPESVLRYWEQHKSDPDGRIYYAYYALFLGTKGDEREYVDAMRLGEEIEPQNALYNVLLAYWYLSRGMQSKEEGSRTVYGDEPRDEVLDRRLFESGVSELRKAVAKPYLRTHQAEVLDKKLNATPRPVLSEDYMTRLALASGERLPHLSRYRALSRKIPGCARLLIAQGKTAEGKAVADTWISYSKLLLGDSQSTLMYALVTEACATILAKGTAGTYDQLGKKAQAYKSRMILADLRALSRTRREASGQLGGTPIDDDLGMHVPRSREPVRSHGSFLHKMVVPSRRGVEITRGELTPGRMHEHVVAEEVVVQLLMVSFFLLLLSAISSGFLWTFRLRRAASAPLLLKLSANDILRILLLGVLLPMALYWFYSRLPWIGGREFGLTSSMWPRFVIEYLLLGLTVMLLPIAMARRTIRRRCSDLDLEVPNPKHEFALHVGLWSRLIIAGIVLAAVAHDPAFANLTEYDVPETSDAFTLAGMIMVFLGVAVVWVTYLIAARQKKMGWGLRGLFLLPVGLLLYCAFMFDGTIAGHTHPVFRLLGLLIVLWLIVTAVVHALRYRTYGLYFGTLSRSIAPVYALAIVFLSVTVTPWQMYNEAQWLRKDLIGIGSLANPQEGYMTIGTGEAREARQYTAQLRRALEGK